MQKLRFAGAGLVALVILWVLVASFAPPLWGAPLLLLNPKMRQTMRDRVTAWLDTLDSGE